MIHVKCNNKTPPLLYLVMILHHPTIGEEEFYIRIRYTSNILTKTPPLLFAPLQKGILIDIH